MTLRVGLARVAGALAALLAAAHGLAILGEGRLPVLAGWHAHGMNAWLALALTAIGWSSSRSAKGRFAAWLRLATAAVSMLAVLSLASGFAHGGEAAAPLVSLVWIVVLLMLVRSLWPVVTPIRAFRLLLLQAGIGLLWAIWVAALSMLVTGGILLDWEPLAGGICWPGVLILGLLAISASVRLARQPAVRGFYAARDDRRIFAGFLGMLFGAVTVASSLIAGMLTARTVEAIGPMLHHSVGGHALAVDHLIARLTDAASRAAQGEALGGGADRASPAAQGALALSLRELRQQLDPLGQVGIRLILPGGPALTEGSLHDGPWASLMERGSMSVMAQNRDGLVLQVMRSLPAPGAVLAIQVRPLRPDAQLQPVELLDTTAVVMLCADERPVGAHCVKRQEPNDFTMRLPRREDGLPWPIERAWQGQDGVLLLRDPDRSAALIAYAPVGATGLGVVQKLLVAPLVQRLGRSVLAALGTLLLVAGVGAWLLYRRSYPVLLGLRYAKAEGQTTLDHLPEGVLTLDARGAILSSSVGAHRLFGCGADGLLGQDLTSLVLDGHEGDRPWQARPGVHPARVVGADGAPIPVEAEVEPLVFEGARRQVVILRDLRTELAHRAELARWERVFFHAPWGVLVSSAEDDRLQLLNPALAAMHGWTVDELRGRPVLDLVAPAHREAARAAAEAMHGAGPSRFETWHVHRDGHLFPVQVDAALVRRDDGGPDDRVVNIQDITERRHAEESLRHSEALLQLVLKSLPVGVWICDEAGRVVATNPAAERIWGGPIELVAGRPVGRRLRRLASGQPIVEGDSPVQRALRTGEAVFGEAIEIDQPDGVCRALYASVPLVGDDGRTLGAIAVTEDLTALLRAEAAVLAASRFFESLFHSAAAGMAVCDASGRFVRVNHALCELLGRPEEQLLAIAPADLSDRDTVREDRALVARLRAGEVDKAEVERRWRRGDGRWAWVMVVVSLLRLPDRDEPQFVLQVVDIDRSRRFQQELQASRARLLNAHRIARLADWEWDPASDEITLSAQGRDILGLPASDAERLSGERWLALVHADDRTMVRAAWRAASTGGPRFALDYRLQWPGAMFIHQQGESVPADSGRPARLVGVLQDISERKRIENELLQSRQRLRALSANEEAAMEQERRHIAREVHDELGQALTALKLELSLLQRRFGSDPALADQAQRMSAMVDGTIGVVRHVISNLRPSALDFGLPAAIEWLAEDFALRWEMPCDVVVSAAEVVLDDLRATAVFRIVQESLTNVARHAHAHQVHITLRTEGPLLQLAVADDGVGFDPAQGQERGGSFGLLGMRERALKIGARLAIDSRPGSGTTVRLELPLGDA